MTDHELEQRIRTAVEHATPNRLDKILSSCGQQNTVACTSVDQEHTDGQMEGANIDMTEKKNKNSKFKKTRKSLAAIAAAAAMFVLCFNGYHLFQGSMKPAVDSVVILDVNPSLSLSLDAEETVLAAEALNDDAGEILGNMDLRGTSLEVAVNAIIGSMLQKGYLGDMQNAILVSVENEDADRGEALQQKVTEAISSAAQNDSLDAAVLSQSISTDDDTLDNLAKQYSISLGKAALIQEVIGQVPALTFEDLAPMTINEIALIAASKNVSSTSVTQSGTASDKAYLSQEEALAVVYGHAGVSAEEVVKVEVEFNSKDGTMIYEVEFETAAKKGEYEINAVTGSVVSCETKDQKHTSSENNGSDDSSGGGYIGESAAKQAALSHAGLEESNADYVKCYLEYENNAPARYCVEFKADKTRYEYAIDLYSGAVLDYDTEAHSNSDGKEKDSADSSSDTSYIGENAALAAAMAHAGTDGDSLTKKHVELDHDGDTMIYKIEFKSGNEEYEYKIDAVSGAVLKAENH